MLMFRSGERGCILNAENENIDLNKSYKRCVTGIDGTKYSFRYFTNENNSAYFVSISEKLANKNDVIEQILSGNETDYIDIDPEFIKESLLTINRLDISENKRKNTEKLLNNQIYTRNFKFDDDFLSDILADCYEGRLKTDNLDYYAKTLAEDVNGFEKYI